MHRRPLPPKPPPAKLPPAKLPPLAKKPPAPPPERVVRLFPEAPEEEDTLVVDDPFDALLSEPALPAPALKERARDRAFRLLDLADGAIAIFGAHRDARVLSALVAAATLRVVLPLALLCVLAASYRPDPPLVKETRPKPAPATVVVPMIVPVIVRQQAPAEESARPVRARRARHRHR